MDTLKSSRDEFCDKLLDRIFIADVINTLDEFEKKVFYLRYYKDTTQAKIGKILGVSQVKVHRTETKILKSIRRFLQ